MKSIIKSAIENMEITDKLCLRSAHHLSEKYQEHLLWEQYGRQSQLNAHQYHMKHNAMGVYYEAFIYESIIEYMKRVDEPIQIIAKGPDMIRPKQKEDVQFQNGIFYDEQGRILVRGSGIDLAEFDMIFCQNGSIGFAEIKKSRKNFNEFEKKIKFKVDVIEEIFHVTPHCFIISPTDIYDKEEVKSLQSQVDCILLESLSLVSIMSPLSKYKIQKFKRQPTNESFIVGLDNLKSATDFNYSDKHDEMKNIFLEALKENDVNNLERKLIDCSRIVNKLIIGIVEPDMLNAIIEEDLKINKKTVKKEDVLKYFDRIVLVFSIPGLRMSIYGRVQKKHNPKPEPVYLKFSLNKNMSYVFQRNISMKRAPGLFMFIDSMSDTISEETLEKLKSHYFKYIPLEKKDKKLAKAFIKL